MSATTLPPPLPTPTPTPGLTPAEAAPEDLDSGIVRVERRLMAREARILGYAEAITQGAKRSIPSKQTVVMAGAGVLAVGLLWRLTRRRPKPRRDELARQHDSDDRSSDEAAPAPRAAAAIPWVGLIGFVLPLLPPRWRVRASPATVATALAVAPQVLRALNWMTGRGRSRRRRAARSNPSSP